MWSKTAMGSGGVTDEKVVGTVRLRSMMECPADHDGFAAAVVAAAQCLALLLLLWSAG